MRLEDIQAGGGGPGAAAARLGLSALSLAWGAATGLRHFAYVKSGLRRRHTLGVPVISVGNLVAGGTGKTPFVVWLARGLLERSHRPGILSRGYGPRAAGHRLSDEGAVLERALGGGMPQVEDPDRVRGGATLLAAHPETDVILLDDGFQHWRLERDLDIVLLDASRPFGFGHLLPRGLLRERPRALSRAGVVVLTRVERVADPVLEDLRRSVARWTPAPVLEVRTVPTTLRIEGREAPLSSLRGRPVIAACGIGRPQAFFEMLERDLGAHLVDRIALADHALPEASFWDALVRRARALAPEGVVVTTRKDAVKIEAPDALAVLEIELEASQGEAACWQVVAEVLAGSPPSPKAASSSAG